VITVEQFCFYTDRALDAQIEILRDLGDRLVNSRPDLPGANSPYVIVNHCLAVMEYWGGHVVAGRESHRDRPGEFTASGSAFELIERAQRARTQLRDDLATMDPAAPPRELPGWDLAPEEATQGAVMLHVYEELAQHLGQLELTRDILRTA
jgi:hypothetical protein